MSYLTNLVYNLLNLLHCTIKKLFKSAASSIHYKVPMLNSVHLNTLARN